MNNSTKISLAAAVAGGYVLGRAKKGRLAFGLATYLAGRRFGLEPQQLVTEGLRKLQEIPQVADLNEQLRGEFKDVGRKALVAAADRKLADLADALHERTARVGSEREEGDEGSDEEEYEPEEEEEEEEGEYENEGDGEEVEEEESTAPAPPTHGPRSSQNPKSLLPGAGRGPAISPPHRA